MITVRQASMFNGFRYVALGTNGQLVGQFEFPWRAQAGNARLRWHERGSTAGDVQLAVRGESGQQSYQIRHDYLTRRAHPDMRYSLLQGEEVLASAEVLQQAGLRRPHIHLRQPFAAQLTRTSRQLGLRTGWRLHQGAHSIGTLEEPAALMLRQSWVLHLPTDISLPVQLFLAFLACQLH